MDKCLVLHPKSELWPKNFEHIYIGLWCLQDVKNSFLQLNKYNIVNTKKNLKEANYDHATRIKIYKSIFKQIVQNLNKINRVNLNQRSWEILLGHWLNRVLNVLIDRYGQIEKAYQDNSFNAVQVSEDLDVSLSDSKNLILEESSDDAEIWEYKIYSHIIHYLNNNKKKIIKKNIFYSKKEKKFQFNLRDSIKSFFIFILNLFNKKSKFTIYGLNLNFFNQIKLFFYLKQVPKIFQSENYKKKKIDYNLRKKFFFHKDKNKDKEKNFYNFFLSILPKIIPTDFVENFPDLKKKVESYKKNNNSKVVITSHGYFYDELFKLFISLYREEFDYYVFQHGNNYFTAKFNIIQPDLNLSDKFFSWGHAESEKKKIIPFYNLNNIGISCGDFINNKNIIIYAKSIMPIRLKQSDSYLDTINSFSALNLLLKKLDNHLKKNIFLKLHPRSESKFKIKIFNEILKEKINILSKKIDKKKIIKRSKIIIHFGDSTGLLETLSIGVPTIAFMPNFNHLRKKVILEYEQLKKVKIIFDDINNLAEHVNKNYNNIKKWWENEETVNVRENFVKKYSKSIYKNTNIIKETANLLDQL